MIVRKPEAARSFEESRYQPRISARANGAIDVPLPDKDSRHTTCRRAREMPLSFLLSPGNVTRGPIASKDLITLKGRGKEPLYPGTFPRRSRNPRDSNLRIELFQQDVLSNSPANATLGKRQVSTRESERGGGGRRDTHPADLTLGWRPIAT